MLVSYDTLKFEELYAYGSETGYNVTTAWIQLLNAMYLNKGTTVNNAWWDLRREMAKHNKQFKSNDQEDSFIGVIEILSALHEEWVQNNSLCQCYKMNQMGFPDDDDVVGKQVLEMHETKHGSIVSNLFDHVICLGVLYKCCFCFFLFFFFWI